MVGKLEPELMLRYIISRVGVLDSSVLVGPSIGEDAAIIDLGDGRVLVVHADPITGAVEYLGWLAVHIPCNDIAVRGARPRWLLPVIYLPEGSSEDLVDRVTEQIDRAARELEAAVVGGHTEFTPGISRPLISMTAIGITGRSEYVATRGARVGDLVLMTKSAGVEGTAILSTDFREVLQELGVPQEIIERSSRFIERVSVVREALLLAEHRLVTSMHDPTEGGLIGGLAEIAYASGTTIYIRENAVRVAEETETISRALGIDPLRLISSGALVATTPPDKAEEALKTLGKEGIEASVIGTVDERSGDLVVVERRSGRIERVSEVYVEDELFRLISTLPSRRPNPANPACGPSFNSIA
ncbi:MAG: AIR synthase family protein [Sulfolobales archaeon]|nr:AIR synthase family protein [Sulfolobales archaeon]MDW8082502.1 AIR synthase family protein [Sulfolobales archaeon]